MMLIIIVQMIFSEIDLELCIRDTIHSFRLFGLSVFNHLSFSSQRNGSFQFHNFLNVFHGTKIVVSISTCNTELSQL